MAITIFIIPIKNDPITNENNLLLLLLNRYFEPTLGNKIIVKN